MCKTKGGEKERRSIKYRVKRESGQFVGPKNVKISLIIMTLFVTYAVKEYPNYSGRLDFWLVAG